MSFSDVTFLLCFLPAFVLCYRVMQYRFRTLFLLIGGFYFYYYAAGVHATALLFGTVVVNFTLARLMDGASCAKRKVLVACRHS